MDEKIKVRTRRDQDFEIEEREVPCSTLVLSPWNKIKIFPEDLAEKIAQARRKHRRTEFNRTPRR